MPAEGISLEHMKSILIVQTKNSYFVRVVINPLLHNKMPYLHVTPIV